MLDRESNTTNGPHHERLDVAVDALRAGVPVRDEWRNALLQQIAQLPRPGSNRSRFFMQRSLSVHPFAAVAACLVAVAAGAGGMKALALIHSNDVPSAVLPAQVNALTPVSGNGNRHNSIRFALVAPGAAHVSIVGDFNGWDATATPMQPVRDGRTWLVDMPLAAGRHVYAFIVDGDLVSDPAAARVVDNDFGSQNSVVLVPAAGSGS